jgi:hypothetical protein
MNWTREPANEAKGMYDEAIREYDQAIGVGGSDPVVLTQS